MHEFLENIEIIVGMLIMFAGLVSWIVGVQNKANRAHKLSEENADSIQCIEKEIAVQDQRLNQLMKGVDRGNDLAEQSIKINQKLEIAIAGLRTDIKYLKDGYKKGVTK